MSGGEPVEPVHETLVVKLHPALEMPSFLTNVTKGVFNHQVYVPPADLRPASCWDPTIRDNHHWTAGSLIVQSLLQLGVVVSTLR